MKINDFSLIKNLKSNYLKKDNSHTVCAFIFAIEQKNQIILATNLNNN